MILVCKILRIFGTNILHIWRVENDFFWISQGKVATYDRWGGQMRKMFMSNFLRI